MVAAVLRAMVPVALACLAGPGVAKPLITSSETTYARACLDFDAAYERMVPICEAALADPGASDRQRVAFLENLGTALLNLDRTDEAEQRYREILTIDPEAAEGLNGLAWVHRDRDEFDKALEMFSAAAARHPSAEALAGQGAMLILSGQGSFEDGMALIEAALVISPDYRWALREKGWRLMRVDRFDEAEAAFRAALEVEDRDSNALYGLARALGEQARHEEALEAINAAITETPGSFTLHQRRAVILYELERYRQSEREADMMLERWPDRPGSHVRKARAVEALGRRKAALEVLAAAQDRLGFDGFVAYWQADMLANDARFAEAEAVLRRLIDEEVPDGDDFELLAYVLLEQGETAEARKAIDAGLELSPGDAWLVYYDALALLDEDRTDDAMARFREAIGMGLPRDRIGFFAGQLVAKGQVARALVLRGQLMADQ